MSRAASVIPEDCIKWFNAPYRDLDNQPYALGVDDKWNELFKKYSRYIHKYFTLPVLLESEEKPFVFLEGDKWWDFTTKTNYITNYINSVHDRYMYYSDRAGRLILNPRIDKSELPAVIETLKKILNGIIIGAYSLKDKQQFKQYFNVYDLVYATLQIITTRKIVVHPDEVERLGTVMDDEKRRPYNPLIARKSQNPISTSTKQRSYETRI